jgi:hypothetical protein
MTPELSEWRIVRRLAEQVCQRVARKVIRSLRELVDGLQSGDDSGLTNAWEEICGHVQGEQSVKWANMCADCFNDRSVGIGWGKGQLYARQPNGDWRLVAGFGPEAD